MESSSSVLAPWQVWTSVVILSIIAMSAIVGNVCTYVVVLGTRRLYQDVSNMLILCLSLADILVAAVNIPFTIVALLAGSWSAAGLGGDLCVFLGFVNMVNLVASVMSLASVSLNRYVRICHHVNYSALYTHRNTILNCVGVWLVSSLLAAPPLLGWAQYTYLSEEHVCYCDWRAGPSYALFMVLTCFGVPCAVMTFSYLNILRVYKRSKRRARRSAALSQQVNGSVLTTDVKATCAAPSSREESKLALKFIVVIVTFIACWLPYAVGILINVYADDLSMPAVVRMLLLTVGYSNSACNPVIYGLMNRQFRSGYRRVLLCKLGQPAAAAVSSVNASTSGTLVTALPVNPRETSA